MVQGAGNVGPIQGPNRKGKVAPKKPVRQAIQKPPLAEAAKRAARVQGKYLQTFTPLQEKSKNQGKNKKGVSSDELSEEAIERTSDVDDLANRFSKRGTKELEEQLLKALKHSIKKTDTVDEILAKVLKFYPDVTLADDAFNFLVEATPGELGLKMLAAQQLLWDRYQDKILAGWNIINRINEYKDKKIGTPQELRDAYREITGNRRRALELFDELSEKYTFPQLQEFIHFMFKSLGDDLNMGEPQRISKEYEQEKAKEKKQNPRNRSKKTE